MLNQNEYHKIIEKNLSQILLPSLPSNLYEPIRYMLDLEGKRLRPSLVLMACNLFSENIQPAVYPALAIELFHNFTLMHDDIMDNSALRRNRPTVHVKWNQNIALLSGDAMLIKAYELLAFQLPEYLNIVLPVFNSTALKVCEGQQYDMDYEHSMNVSINDYIKMVEHKTAVLLAASLKIGALTGGSGTNEADLLYEFGKNIGIAFQLQDDLIDVFGDSGHTGKEIGNDIVSNKKTILLIEAISKANGKDLRDLLDWLNKKMFDKEQKINAIKTIYNNLSLYQSTQQLIKTYYQQAFENLDKLNLEPEKRNAIKAFTDKLENRKK
jgi:geranylgeranyl diphosphate synthase, type II